MVLLKDIESSGIKIGIVFDLFVYKIHGAVSRHFSVEQKFSSQVFKKWTLELSRFIRGVRYFAGQHSIS